RVSGFPRAIYRRIVPLGAHPLRRWAVWLIVAVALDLLLVRSIPLFTAIALLFIVFDINIKRVSVGIAALAFAVTLVGFLALWLGSSSPVLLLVVFPALLALRFIMAYSPMQRIRLAALMGMA